MTQKMVFDDAAEFEKFNKMYQEYLHKGIESKKALAMTKEAFWPTKSLSEEGRKLYDDYVFNYGLSPEDAYILASRKNAAKSSESVESKKEEKTEERQEEKTPAVKSFFDDWFAPVKDWTDMLQPVDKLFKDSFAKDFGMPRWMDWWDGRKRHGQKNNEKGNCHCGCEKKEEKTPAMSNSGVDIVNDEIKKVLKSFPSEEVNSKTTKVNILKNDPNDYEFKVDHTSADGRSHFHCTKKFYKNV